MPKLEAAPEPNVEYAYGMYIFTSKHRVIRSLRQSYQPSIHGNKTWGAGFLMMDYLTHHGLRRGSKTMEIGCGWGQVSVFCARRFKSEMTAVDLDAEVFPYVDAMAELNEVELTNRQADFARMRGATLGEHRYIVGSDVCFWDSLVKPLAHMVDRALDNGTERIVISDPGRPTFHEFCDLVSQKHATRLRAWYATEPTHFEGEVVEIRLK